MEGIVKFFNTSKGFGFIELGNGEKDVFVGSNGLNGLTLNEGDKVTFDTEETAKGLAATNVKKVN